ncbi:MAG: NAD(P)/FAD-dependent oxidoreductase [Pseudomonadota bacterium]
MNGKKNIVIVGGGFAGTAAISGLDTRLPDGYQLVVISEESYTTFSPMLPEAVGASIFPEQVVAPIRELLDPRRGARFIMGRVTATDLQARTVTCGTLSGPLTIDYDQLVLACGNRARLDLLPGAAEHALPLKTVGDAMHIRNTVLRRLARMELETERALIWQLGHFVVIGGGFSGVEVAGELVDCLASVAHFYPRAERAAIRVTLIQDAERLLLELPPSLGAAACASLVRRGVDVRFGLRAQYITEHGVGFEQQFVAAATVISTIGTRANPLIERLGIALERGRLPVAADLSVAGAAGVWAIGDCAQVPNSGTGTAAPPTAQFAVREGALLARNLLASLRQQPTRPFNYRARGMMAAIGHMKGVAEIYGVPLAGLPAWLAWRAYYLSQMPTLRRKLRVFVEWTWGMFFAVDITHLRFTRSAEHTDEAHH